MLRALDLGKGGNSRLTTWLPIKFTEVAAAARTTVETNIKDGGYNG